MRKKMFIMANSFSGLFWMAVYLIIVVPQVGCNSNTQKPVTDSSGNWIILNIKFKPNTTAEMRDMSVRSIEKILVDSVRALKAGRYPDFFPMITIIKQPFGDTTEYTFRVGTGNSGLTYSPQDTSKPICYCSRGCGVCRMLTTYVVTPPPQALEFQNIARIYFPNDNLKQQ